VAKRNETDKSARRVISTRVLTVIYINEFIRYALSTLSRDPCLLCFEEGCSGFKLVASFRVMDVFWLRLFEVDWSVDDGVVDRVWR